MFPRVPGVPFDESICNEVAHVERPSGRLFLRPTEDPRRKPPTFFKLFEEQKFKSYDAYFNQSEDFSYPYCTDPLYPELDLDIDEYYTNMANARGRYPPQEYADDIRQKQASKLAFR